MEAGWTQYLDLLDQLGKVLEELTQLAQKKTQAVMRDDLQGVDECMRREQALSLNLRSMDRKREQMLERLGLEGTSLSGLAAKFPQEQRLQAKRAAQRLHERYQLYLSAAGVSRTTLECNLHQIEKYLKEEPGDLPSPGSLADIRA